MTADYFGGLTGVIVWSSSSCLSSAGSSSERIRRLIEGRRSLRGPRTLGIPSSYRWNVSEHGSDRAGWVEKA